MKIGIITLNGYFNYGNRLQNYALQQVLINECYNVETVVFEFEKVNDCGNVSKEISLIDRLTNLKNKSILDVVNKLHLIIDTKVNKKKYNYLKLQRENIFKKFTEQNIIERHIRIENDQIPYKFLEEYDYFITGSDQVWNPNYNEGSPINFLAFFEATRSIAYAPSFGVSEVPLIYHERYKMWLNNIKYLSIRENDGAKIIKELTGRDAPVLVDPTLLLNSKQWRKLTENVTMKQSIKYLLTYFIGAKRDTYRKTIESYAVANNLKIINMNNIKEEDSYIFGPKEFLCYIDNCDLFCTDSFHGTVFSILFQKPFVVFERVDTASMYSRIETLLDKFGLTSRKECNISSSEVMNIDYSHVLSILEEERQKSFNYLRNSMNIKDE